MLISGCKPLTGFVSLWGLDNQIMMPLKRRGQRAHIGPVVAIKIKDPLVVSWAVKRCADMDMGWDFCLRCTTSLSLLSLYWLWVF